MRPSLRLSLLAVALLTLLAGAGGPSAVRAAAPLQVVSDTATADFPNSLSFALTADAPQTVTEAEVRYHAAFDPVTQVEQADLPPSPATHVEAQAKVDAQTHYLPPGVDVLYHWSLTLADGSTVDTPEQTLFYMDHQHNWIVLTSGQVTLYYYAGTQSFGRQMLDTTTQAMQRLKDRFHASADEPVHVVVFGSNRDLAAALPPNSAEWIGGFADPTLHLIVTGIVAGDTGEVQRILSHESVHLVVGQVTDNPFNSPPPWVDEGLATYYQQVEDTRLTPALNNAVKNGQLIPVPALDASFPDDQNRALLSYAESRSVVQFIIEQKGEDKMAAVLNAFPQGVSYEQAVEQGLGISQAELDREWKSWLGYSGDKPVGYVAPASTTATLRDAAEQHADDLTILALAASAGAALVLRSKSARR